MCAEYNSCITAPSYAKEIINVYALSIFFQITSCETVQYIKQYKTTLGMIKYNNYIEIKHMQHINMQHTNNKDNV